MILLLVHAAHADTLTLEQALAAAKDHPSVRQAQAAADAADARADQARAGLLPTLDGGASWSTSTSTGTSLTAELSASQLVWDFGKTAGAWRSWRESAAARLADEAQAELDAEWGVRNAYFVAVADKSLVEVATQTLANQDRHFVQTQAFVDVGIRAPIDLATARTQQANARVALLQAQNAYDIAKATLHQAMGVEGGLDYDVSDQAFPAVEDEASTTDALLEQALATRPDAAAMRAELEAEKAQVRSALATYAPSLSVTAGASEAGSGAGLALPGVSPSAKVGASLDVPLFHGLSGVAQVREARAALVGLEAQSDALRQQVRLELETALRSVAADKAVLAASEEAVLAAQAQLDLAEGRYQTGVGSALELDDAQLALSSAAAQRVKAIYALAAARAGLMSALGR